uniref:Uncharacterized protein n=1 Tax=Cucumis melo TaxID=3656 RepID=A0A9I9EGT7_CUCME
MDQPLPFFKSTSTSSPVYCIYLANVCHQLLERENTWSTCHPEAAVTLKIREICVFSPFEIASSTRSFTFAMFIVCPSAFTAVFHLSKNAYQILHFPFVRPTLSLPPPSPILSLSTSSNLSLLLHLARLPFNLHFVSFLFFSLGISFLQVSIYSATEELNKFIILLHYVITRNLKLGM